MPNNIVIAQADAPAEAGIEAQVETQIQDLVNEMKGFISYWSPATTGTMG